MMTAELNKRLVRRWYEEVIRTGQVIEVTRKPDPGAADGDS